MVEEWHHPVKQVAQHFGITSARVYQLRTHYQKYGEIPILKKRGRKSRIISEHLRQDIIGLKLNLNLGSSGIVIYLRSVHGIKIGSSLVHRVILEEGLTEKIQVKALDVAHGFSMIENIVFLQFIWTGICVLIQ